MGTYTQPHRRSKRGQVALWMHLVIAPSGLFAGAWSLMQGAESQLGLEKDGEVKKPAPGQYIAGEYERIAVGGAEKRALGSITSIFGGRGLCRARVAKNVRGSNVCPKPQRVGQSMSNWELGIILFTW